MKSHLTHLLKKEFWSNQLKTATNTIQTRKFWSEFVTMTLGMLIAAVCVVYFLIPSKIVVGSITGLSIVVTRVLENIGVNIDLTVVVTAINAVLLLLAYILIGPEFGFKTVYCALILGPMIKFWEAVYPVENLLTEPGQYSVMNDPWFDLCGFVLLLSISQAILFRINASTGGLDILAKIVNKYFHLDIGTSVTVAGGFICLSALSINSVRLVIIGLIGTWINGIVVDYFMATINKRKRVCIISEEYERIRKYIIEELNRGCCLYEATGGYSGMKNIEIQTILTQAEFSDLLEFIQSNNLHSFVTAGNVSEIYGLWFKHSNRHRSIHRIESGPVTKDNNTN